MSAQFDSGLCISPFDPRFRSGIDWEEMQRQEDAKGQKSERIKARLADKQFLEQPPGYRPPTAKPRVAATPRRVVAEKPKHVPVPWVKAEDLTAASTANGRRQGSKAGRLRLAMLERGPLTSEELATVAGVASGRMARDLLGYDLKLGVVKIVAGAKPALYYVPENPPKVQA